MTLILLAVTRLINALESLLLAAAIWFGRVAVSLITKLVHQPIGLAVRVHLVVFGMLLIAFVLAEAWDIGHRFILPLIHLH